ncbi:MAG TPA: tetratricopeptide repeat protein [Candidatus Baltobacteraceae bacterium]|jgi:tetratricopeptide (TPR) repeat protein
MKRLLFALIPLMVATFGVSAVLPASAQTQQQHDWCYADSATDAQTIEGCTALIKAGTLTGPDLAIVYRDRGLSYYHMQQNELAMADYSQAIGLDPNYAEAYDDRGIIFSKLGQTDRALEEYNTSIRVKPTFAYAFNNRGNLFFKRGDLAAALSDTNQAITLNSNVGLFYTNRALIYVKLRQCPQAAQDFVSAKHLNRVFTLTPEVRAACGPVIDAALSR